LHIYEGPLPHRIVDGDYETPIKPIASSHQQEQYGAPKKIECVRHGLFVAEVEEDLPREGSVTATL
jgi:hypothetical protein